MPIWISGAKIGLDLEFRIGNESRDCRERRGDRKSVWPSAGCLSTSPAPSAITAPGLFSTITFQPSPSESAVAMIRARMSGGVLAELGTMIRMTLDG